MAISHIPLLLEPKLATMVCSPLPISLPSLAACVSDFSDLPLRLFYHTNPSSSDVRSPHWATYSHGATSAGDAPISCSLQISKILNLETKIPTPNLKIFKSRNTHKKTQSYWCKMESRVVDLIRNMNRFLCSNCRGTCGGVRASVNEITSGVVVVSARQWMKSPLELL